MAGSHWSPRPRVAVKPLVGRFSLHGRLANQRLTSVTYAATLDVPRHIVEFLARYSPQRRRIGTPRGSRALGPFRQAVLVLRWFRERGCVHCLARDAGVSRATGYRYLHEGIGVLADQAPGLHEISKVCQESGITHVILDGTLIECDRVAGVRENGHDLWFSRLQLPHPHALPRSPGVPVR